MAIGREFYELIKTYGGISLQYQGLAEGDFAASPGPAYVPPERGVFKVTAARTVQLLGECPVVVETFQTSNGTVGLPANTALDATNDAGDGRLFFLKNSGTGDLLLQTYQGAPLYQLNAGQSILVLGNTLDQWDLLYTTDVPVDLGAVNLIGSSPSLARADHQHRGVRSITLDGTETFGDLTLLSAPNVRITANGGGSYTIGALGLSANATTNSTRTLTAASAGQQYFTGATAGQIVALPSGATLRPGQIFTIENQSQQNIKILDGLSSLVTWAFPYQTVWCILVGGDQWNYWMAPQAQQSSLLTTGASPNVGLVVPVPNNSQMTVEYLVQGICTAAGPGPNAPGDAGTWKRNSRFVNIGGTVVGDREQTSFTSLDVAARPWAAQAVPSGSNVEIQVTGSASTVLWNVSATINVISF